MINITPYIQKLELLKEYMFLKISGKGKVWMINIDAIPINYTVQELMDIWNQTGFLMYRSNEDAEPPRELSFEEFYQSKINKTVTN